MYKISFYVPVSHLEQIKEALFAQGAGRFGSYDRCCWQVRGQSQFQPLPGSRPCSGYAFELEAVEEFKVEMICEEHSLKKAVEALLSAHPYEQPAYAVHKVLTLADL